MHKTSYECYQDGMSLISANNPRSWIYQLESEIIPLINAMENRTCPTAAGFLQQPVTISHYLQKEQK